MVVELGDWHPGDRARIYSAVRIPTCSASMRIVVQRRTARAGKFEIVGTGDRHVSAGTETPSRPASSKAPNTRMSFPQMTDVGWGVTPSAQKPICPSRRFDRCSATTPSCRFIIKVEFLFHCSSEKSHRQHIQLSRQILVSSGCLNIVALITDL